MIVKSREELPKEDGFYWRSREGIYYVEGERAAEIGTDMLVGGTLIYTSYVKWIPPHENEPMPKVKSAEIIAKLEQWMTQNGAHYILK